MSNILELVRDELLREAKNSPAILLELAQLEKYIAETYSSRVFVELLQNADDAKSKKFLVDVSDDYLICANDGDIFSYTNFYGLCRNAASDKSRGSSIGYRGIGFKSIAEIATEAHIISGETKATFSKSLTREVLGVSSNIPLIRIPHHLAISKNSDIENRVKDILNSGYSTIFIFTGINKDKIANEFQLFDSDFLLFLNNIENVSLENIHTKKEYSCKRLPQSNTEYESQITSSNQTDNWRIFTGLNCSLAISLIDKDVVSLKPENALAHAFLPTNEQTGMPVRVNADFSTDPSRTRIALDETTYRCIYSLCDLIEQICRSLLSTSINKLYEFLKVITPNFEILTIKMQRKVFKTEFVLELQKRLCFLENHLILVPAWFNEVDTNNIISRKIRKKHIFTTDDNMIINFLKFLNVKSLQFQDIFDYLDTENHLSRTGNIEIIAFILQNIIMLRDKYPIKKLPILESKNGQIINALELTKTPHSLSEDFIIALSSKININEFNSVFLGVTGKVTVKSELSIDVTNNSKQSIKEYPHDLIISNATTNSTINVNLTQSNNLLSEWRSAELYLLDILSSRGYKVEDRSRQNLGYDLYAIKDNIEYFFEIKLLDSIGKPFIITSNEEVVAREYKDKYIIALIVKKREEVQVSFIQNPAENLSFVRQCRQWVWECSEYVFNPVIFKLDV